MIPPSLGLTLYAVFTGNSIGALLLAGVVPGLLTAPCYSAVIARILRADPEAAPRASPRSSPRERRRAALAAQPVLLQLPFLCVRGEESPGLQRPTNGRECQQKAAGIDRACHEGMSD